MKKLFYPFVYFVLLLLAAGLTACKGDSVVSESSAPAKSNAAPSPSSPTIPSTPAAPPATANTTPASAQSSPTPAPTLLPVMKQAQANPGVPVAVPESMKRPLNAEEMKKALEAMPPEVRARIQGMQAAPQGVKPLPVKPQTTPKP